jgi:uncharacterized protein (DUF488 family)
VSAPSTLYTIGHGDREIATFVGMLRDARSALLFDVRRHPGSRRHPHFGHEALAHALADAGIGYRWEGEALGGRRRTRPDSRHVAWRSASFRGYADHMETPDFVAALARLLDAARKRPVAVMCAERHPSQCHRQLIADAALARGVPVVHLLEPGRSEPAKLHDFARLEGAQVIYDLQPSAIGCQRPADEGRQPDLFSEADEPTADS